MLITNFIISAKLSRSFDCIERAQFSIMDLKSTIDVNSVWKLGCSSKLVDVVWYARYTLKEKLSISLTLRSIVYSSGQFVNATVWFWMTTVINVFSAICLYSYQKPQQDILKSHKVPSFGNVCFQVHHLHISNETVIFACCNLVPYCWNLQQVDTH